MLSSVTNSCLLYTTSEVGKFSTNLSALAGLSLLNSTLSPLRPAGSPFHSAPELILTLSTFMFAASDYSMSARLFRTLAPNIYIGSKFKNFRIFFKKILIFYPPLDRGLVSKGMPYFTLVQNKGQGSALSISRLSTALKRGSSRMLSYPSHARFPSSSSRYVNVKFFIECFLLYSSLFTKIDV